MGIAPLMGGDFFPGVQGLFGPARQAGGALKPCFLSGVVRALEGPSTLFFALSAVSFASGRG